jgi:hypothetical protein
MLPPKLLAIFLPSQQMVLLSVDLLRRVGAARHAHVLFH